MKDLSVAEIVLAVVLGGICAGVVEEAWNHHKAKSSVRPSIGSPEPRQVYRDIEDKEFIDTLKKAGRVIWNIESTKRPHPHISDEIDLVVSCEASFADKDVRYLYEARYKPIPVANGRHEWVLVMSYPSLLKKECTPKSPAGCGPCGPCRKMPKADE